MKKTDDGLTIGIGCVGLVLVLAWLGFVGWLLYTLAEWLTTK